MKRFYIFLLLLLFSGCGNEQKKAIENPKLANVNGNTYGNIINHGFVAKQDSVLVYMK